MVVTYDDEAIHLPAHPAAGLCPAGFCSRDRAHTVYLCRPAAPRDRTGEEHGATAGPHGHEQLRAADPPDAECADRIGSGAGAGPAQRDGLAEVSWGGDGRM